MDERGLKNGTKRIYIYAFQTWAKAAGRPVDVSQVFERMPPREESYITVIPPEKIQMIPEVCENLRNLAAMMTGLYTGIRGIELTLLLMEDVDIAERVIHVKNRGKKTMKNRRERDVPIPDELVPYLEDYLETRTEYLVRKKKTLPPAEDYFFITNRCTPMSTSLLRGNMWRFKSRIGYKKGERFSFHLERHTCNSAALADGMTIDEAIENFGWSDARIAVRYTHASIEKRKKTMKNFSYKTKTTGKRGDDSPAAPIIKK